MSRPSKSSKSSKFQTSNKKHTAVPPKGGVAEASAAKPTVAAPKTLKISLPEPAAKPVEASKVSPASTEHAGKAAAASTPASSAASHEEKKHAHGHAEHAHSEKAQAEKAQAEKAHAEIAAAAQPVADRIAQGPSAELQALLTDLQSPSASTRLTAATEIGRTGDRHAVSALIDALRDADADVARESATSLGHLGDRSAVDPLIDVLGDTNGFYHSVVRAAAASSLGQLKDTRAVESLLTALTDPIAEPSVEAIRALTVLNDRRAISAFIDVVRNRSGFFVATVRRAAVLGLAHFGGEDAIAQLRFVAADEWEDNVIRDEADAAVRQANN